MTTAKDFVEQLEVVSDKVMPVMVNFGSGTAYYRVAEKIANGDEEVIYKITLPSHNEAVLFKRRVVYYYTYYFGDNQQTSVRSRINGCDVYLVRGNKLNGRGVDGGGDVYSFRMDKKRKQVLDSGHEQLITIKGFQYAIKRVAEHESI